MKTKLMVKNTIGKDGKTYKNMILVFLDGVDKEIFSLPVKPTFEMSSKAYSKLMDLLHNCEVR